MTTVAAAKLSHNKGKAWKHAKVPVELVAEDICFSVRLGNSFRTTEQLVPGQGFFGQERALASLEIGLGLSGNGFIIFVSSLTAVGNRAHQLISHTRRLGLCA